MASNRQLRLLHASWTASWVEDWLVPVAMSIYAYSRGGAAAAGLAGVARMLPSTVGAPVLGVLVDRWRREVVLRVAYGVQAAACLAMAAAYWAGMPLVVLFVLLGAEGFVSVLIQPAVTALVPWLTRSPLELTATNAGLSIGRAAGICIGPLLAGTLTETVDAGSAFAVGGLLMSASTVLALALRAPRGARTEPTPRGAGSVAHEMSVGFRALVSDRAAGSIAALLASVQGLLRGLFSVLAVVASIRLLGLGGSGAGYLLAATGFGGVLAGIALLLRPGLSGRLADTFAGGVVLRTAPFAFVAVLASPVPALALMVIYGVGNTAMTTGGYTLLQRLIPNSQLGRALGVIGMLTTLGIVGGAALAAPLLSVASVSTLLIAMGVLWPLAAVACWPLARRAEGRAVAHDAEIELLRRIPFMTLLPLTALEGCAAFVRRQGARAGEVVIRKGEVGDRLYLLLEGSAVISIDGREIRRLAPGAWFGEVALLRNSARTATVTMTSDARLAFLERHHFLRALSCNADAEQSALSTLSDLVGIDDEAAGTPPRPERPVEPDPSLALATLPLLANAPASVVSDLVKHTTQIETAAGDVVFNEGDAADAVYMVLSGTLTISIESEDVREIAAGDWFGELAVLRRSNRTATVRGSTPAVLLAIQADAFRAAVETSQPRSAT
jgi:CRP-like cAMP-binding protein